MKAVRDEAVVRSYRTLAKVPSGSVVEMVDLTDRNVKSPRYLRAVEIHIC